MIVKVSAVLSMIIIMLMVIPACNSNEIEQNNYYWQSKKQKVVTFDKIEFIISTKVEWRIIERDEFNKKIGDIDYVDNIMDAVDFQNKRKQIFGLNGLAF